MNLSEVTSKLIDGQKMFKLHNQVKQLERDGRKIIGFYLGDPDFQTPMNVKFALWKALVAGETHYAPSTGIWKLKIAYQQYIYRYYGFEPDLDQILVTAGANIQLFYALSCICNPGDNIYIPNPGFPSYYSIAKYLNLEINDLGKEPTAYILNSPCNPTGEILNEQVIQNTYNKAKCNDAWIISDDIYSELCFKKDYFSTAMIDQCKERTILVKSLSKSHAMTGWRVGLVVAPKELIEKMGILLETTSSCVSPFIQTATVEALNNCDRDILSMKAEYIKRRDYIVKEINSIPGLSCETPDGAFYVWVNIREIGMTSNQFQDFMLDNGVALCSGTMFGSNGEGFARLAYCNSMDNIKKGLEIMRKSLIAYRNNLINQDFYC